MFLKELYLSKLDTKYLGRTFTWVDEVTSTNDYLLDKPCVKGEAVSAMGQTKGRGRSGRTWFTAENGLAFSLLLPVNEPNVLMPINILSGYSVADTLKAYAAVKVKWPNDCVIDGKKICGMLIDARFSGGTLEKAVLGIGINLNSVAFPENIVKKGTTIEDYYGNKLKREEVMASIVNNLERYIDLFTQGKLDMVGKWQDYSANLGKEVSLHMNGVITQVREKGIDSSGSLIAVKSNGAEEIVTSGEIGYDFSS